MAERRQTDLARSLPDRGTDVLLTDTGGRMLDRPLGSHARPSWRGRVHLVSLVVAVPFCVVVAVLADGARARTGVLVYAGGLCAMFAVSTAYHRWVNTIRARAIWRRADHATIFVAIAGTATPLCLSVLSRPTSWWALAAVWAMAATGVIAKVTGGRRGNQLGNVSYIANGWAGVVIVPALWSAGHVASTALLLAGGLVYTVGALGFAKQRPVLAPTVFGYHEVWHVSTVAAATMHFIAIWLVTT